jgi:hypothetical protein
MENIIEKLKKFREIQPEPEYNQYSKLVILATPLTDKLRNFRTIVPDPSYSRRSKLAILPLPIFNFNWQLTFALASLFLVLITGGLFNYLKPSAPNLNSLALQNDLGNININIQLAKIEYYQKSKEAVSLALKEISGSQTGHLNSSILESEKAKLEGESSSNKEIENLLNQIIL